VRFDELCWLWVAVAGRGLAAKWHLDVKQVEFSRAHAMAVSEVLTVGGRALCVAPRGPSHHLAQWNMHRCCVAVEAGAEAGICSFVHDISGRCPRERERVGAGAQFHVPVVGPGLEVGTCCACWRLGGVFAAAAVAGTRESAACLWWIDEDEVFFVCHCPCAGACIMLFVSRCVSSEAWACAACQQ
jgi:hypothetical protein